MQSVIFNMGQKVSVKKFSPMRVDDEIGKMFLPAKISTMKYKPSQIQWFSELFLKFN